MRATRRFRAREPRLISPRGIDKQKLQSYMQLSYVGMKKSSWWTLKHKHASFPLSPYNLGTISFPQTSFRTLLIAASKGLLVYNFHIFPALFSRPQMVPVSLFLTLETRSHSLLHIIGKHLDQLQELAWTSQSFFFMALS